MNFKAYESTRLSKSKGKNSKNAANQPLLLHSSDHQSVDYTARGDAEINGSEPSQNHFLGVYDPETGKMDVVQVKMMTMRGTVRAKQTDTAAEAARQVIHYYMETLEGNMLTIHQTIMERKTDLGQTFGTKKAKKVIQERVLNAISPTKNGNKDPSQIDDASQAMLSSVGNVTSSMATREELQAVVDDAKPVPIANVNADEIQDVYDPEVIIGSDILNQVPIREWQEKVKHKEGIQTHSQFVANRVNAIAGNDTSLQRLRILRYLSFVIVFYLISRPGRERGTRRVPPRDKLREQMDPAPEAVVENIRRKFSDAGNMRKFHIDLLMTHCCAFACIIDNFEVQTHDLRNDLRLDQSTINQYFNEIGARVKPVKSKEGSGSTMLARLTLPLNLPKQRVMAPKRR